MRLQLIFHNFMIWFWSKVEWRAGRCFDFVGGIWMNEYFFVTLNSICLIKRLMNERNLIFHNASCCLCCGWYVFSRPAMPWTESYTSLADVMLWPLRSLEKFRKYSKFRPSVVRMNESAVWKSVVRKSKKLEVFSLIICPEFRSSL